MYKAATEPSKTWHDDQGRTYDVKKLWAIADQHQAVNASTRALLQLIENRKWKNQQKGIDEPALASTSGYHKKKVEEADLRYPLIIGETRSGVERLMDGAHRLVKAREEGRKQLPVVRLPNEEIEKAYLGLKSEGARTLTMQEKSAMHPFLSGFCDELTKTSSTWTASRLAKNLPTQTGEGEEWIRDQSMLDSTGMKSERLPKYTVTPKETGRYTASNRNPVAPPLSEPLTSYVPLRSQKPVPGGYRRAPNPDAFYDISPPHQGKPIDTDQPNEILAPPVKVVPKEAPKLTKPLAGRMSKTADGVIDSFLSGFCDEIMEITGYTRQ